MNYSAIAHLKGRLADGCDPDVLNGVLGEIEDSAGVSLICVWEYFDDAGYGGASQLYLTDGDTAYELSGQLWPWLSDASADHPGQPEEWRGAPAADLVGWQDYSGDGFHNLARTVDT